MTELTEAIEAVNALHHDVWFDVGPKFSCTEADAIAGLFRAVGLTEHADNLLCGHAAGDDEDADDSDLHEWCEEAPGWRYKEMEFS